MAAFRERVNRNVDQTRRKLPFVAAHLHNPVPVAVPRDVDAACPEQRDLMEPSGADVVEQPVLADLRLDHVQNAAAAIGFYVADKHRAVTLG